MNQNIKSIAPKAAPTTAVHIDELHLDLKGYDPTTAQAAMPLLGPALANALHGAPQPPTINAAQSLANTLATQLASRIQGGSQ